MWSTIKSRAGIFLLGSLFGGSGSYFLLTRGSKRVGSHPEDTNKDPGKEEETASSAAGLCHTGDTLFKWALPNHTLSSLGRVEHIDWGKGAGDWKRITCACIKCSYMLAAKCLILSALRLSGNLIERMYYSSKRHSFKLRPGKTPPASQ